MRCTKLDNDVNTFWLDYKDFMYSMGLGPDIETVWAFLEEHSRTEIAEDVLDEAREEAREEAYEIGYNDGYGEGYDDGDYEGFRGGYDTGYCDARELYA